MTSKFLIASRVAYIFIIIIGVLSISLFSRVNRTLASLGIDSIQPESVSNAIATTIIITGSDFQDGATVILEGYGTLQSNFINTSTLHALLPAGVPPGIFTVQVRNPDGETSVYPDALTIIQQTPTAESTPTSPPQQPGYERPVVIINSFTPNKEKISIGQDFDLNILLYNAGQKTATNVVATFSFGDLIPRQSGGVAAVGNIAPDNRSDFSQSFIVSNDLWGQSIATTDMTLTYTDPNGVQYTEVFKLSISLFIPGYSPPSPTPTITPTPTEGPPLRPQLVISNYETSIDPLQPGVKFTLNMTIVNEGDSDAKGITMIVGGGSQIPVGTPDTGGISGSAGEFSNFAPVGSSNVQFIGDITRGSSLQASQMLIVNVSTNPGAYPLKISYVYNDSKNNLVMDDQVITLLVYSLPMLDINFYRDPNPIFAGQPNQLPLQVVNLGRNSAVLGNMRVTAPDAEMSNNVIFIGPLEPGGYFPLDANFTPFQVGSTNIIVTIDYTNDFNQSQIISQTLSIEVLESFAPEPEGPEMGPGEGEPSPPPQEDTIWSKLKQFLLGFLGLDSGVSTGTVLEGMPPTEGQPVESLPAEPIIGP